MTAPVLAVQTTRLTKYFGPHVAVSDIDLEVPQGALFGLIGPNGAGKTTTLRMLAGLTRPTSGTVRLGGVSVDAGDRATLTRKVGWVPDGFGVYEDMRAWEYLDFFARCYAVPAADRARLVDELLDLVDLTEKRDADVNTLSRGMKQRLCLAHALVHAPDVLLLDEPAAGLDPRARIELRALLTELTALGTTIIVSSHILSELAEMCDGVAIMERGRLLAQGDVGDLVRQGHSQAVQVVRVELARSHPALRDTIDGWEDHRVVLMDDAVDADGDGAERDARWLTIELPAGDEARAALLARLVGQGAAVTAFVPVTRGLEDVFMAITRGEVN